MATDRPTMPAETGLPFLDVTLRNMQAIRAARRHLDPHHAFHLAEKQRAAHPVSDIRTHVPGASAPDSDVR
ncbi:hypothetical protein GCM10010495_32390 [Kitasatospora herbaricolor]|uniref:hypothetical protein n=1 Tax=Kitasatospora herbaricolor TaxID=68217 RepID=UPI0017488844|nr:hypothetical protein [Kitasatospora herbaricolor]MDQ0307693.1 hypothetical protein [Kitasatospora herbaricolor]GGV15836.1 hypothetical protein GCM10010495_32390 [Kitasatospora herbaricolor]